MSSALITAVAATRGRSVTVAPLADGMSSSAWLAVVDGVEWVVRVPTRGHDRAAPNYHAEARLNAALRAAGVPAPDSEAIDVDGTMCSIAPRLVGRPVEPQQWTDGLVGDVAEALAAAHSLTPAPFGLDGPVGRFHLARIWPFDDTALDTHPVVTTFPDLREAIEQREPAIREAGAAHAVVTHTDLHADHLLVDDGRLTGLLDFGDALAGPPAWDIACLRYYHGDSVAQRVARAYPAGDEVYEASNDLGIAWALYKLDKTPERRDVVERVHRLLVACQP